MKISSKIVILVAFSLLILAVNGWVGDRLLSRMGCELRGVVNRDVALMKIATEITRHQLEKAVLFERMRRVAEELVYQETTPARREHLLFHISLAKKSFDDLAKEGALSIINGKMLLDENLRAAKKMGAEAGLDEVVQAMKEIEKAHIHYDALIKDLLQMMGSGQYEVTPEMLGQIHRDEKKISDELQNLMDKTKAFTGVSLKKAANYERTAERALWLTFCLSLLSALGLAFWIMRSINGPLKHLMDATREIGKGNLEVHLKDLSDDEIGRVSRAFNLMTLQLKESKQRLEKQSEMLRRNLHVTEQQKKDLEKVNRELDRFVQTVSHDIRSPLMGITLYADYLKNNYRANLDQKGRDSLEGICRTVTQATALIKDLLALTRISRIRNPYGYVQIAALLNDVVTSLEYKIRDSLAVVDVQRNMPAIICDGIKLKEVFFNLLSNAIKFSSGQGGVRPLIKVEYIDQVSAHEFIVRDNGIGISPEHHEEVFAIFKRLDNSGKYEGTGAGLSIVKSVIDDHGGRIWVESALGQGAAIHFTIPKGLEIHGPISA